MRIDDLATLFLEELKDIDHAEQQLVKALPKMAKAASSSRLKDAFESHLEATKQHVARIEEIFEAYDQPAVAKPCKGMTGLLEEGQADRELTQLAEEAINVRAYADGSDSSENA